MDENKTEMDRLFGEESFEIEMVRLQNDPYRNMIRPMGEAYRNLERVDPNNSLLDLMIVTDSSFVVTNSHKSVPLDFRNTYGRNTDVLGMFENYRIALLHESWKCNIKQ